MNQNETIPNGTVFGNLTVIEYIGVGTHRRRQYKCRCLCGKEVVKFNCDLRRENKHVTRCCGYDCPSTNYQEAFNRKVRSDLKKGLYNRYKYNAKKAGKEFTLSEEQASELFFGSCHYCGSPPNTKFPKPIRRDYILYNGIDRLNNSIGYTPENCVSCCWIHNLMKGRLSETEFIEACKTVANHGQK